MSYLYVIVCYIIVYYITLYYITLNYIILCHIILYYIILCCSLFRLPALGGVQPLRPRPPAAPHPAGSSNIIR